MAVPNYQNLMLPIMELAMTGEFRIGHAVTIVADRLGSYARKLVTA